MTLRGRRTSTVGIASNRANSSPAPQDKKTDDSSTLLPAMVSDSSRKPLLPKRGGSMRKSRASVATINRLLDEENDENHLTRFPSPSLSAPNVQSRGICLHLHRIFVAAIALAILASWFYLWYTAKYFDTESITLPSDPNDAFQVEIQKHRPKPFFPEIVLVDTLDHKHLPTTKHGHPAGRLVIVGDVHGMKHELVALLSKMDFDNDSDHLVFTGDMVTKGPDSIGVLDLAMDMGASCVRGNHEDRVLYYYEQLHTKGRSIDEDGLSNGEKKDFKVAKILHKKHANWLKKCPVILRVGEIAGMGEVVVVHGGLVPGVPLDLQDPFYTMNMRSLFQKPYIPSSGRDGILWSKVWNKFQSYLSKHSRTTVVYGHDSKTGLNIQKYSKGLDSGCVGGNKLTALVIEGPTSKNGKAHQRLVHVKC